MRFGIRWFVGVGEHDYEESGFSEFTSLAGLFARLQHEVPDDELLFDAFADGRQEHIYWVTDDFGFELYQPV